MPTLKRLYTITPRGSVDTGMLHTIRDMVKSGVRGARGTSVGFDSRNSTVTVVGHIEREHLETILGKVEILGSKGYEIHEMDARQVVARGNPDHQVDMSAYNRAMYTAAASEELVGGLTEQNSKLHDELSTSKGKITALEERVPQIQLNSPLEAIAYFVKTREIPNIEAMNKSYEDAVTEIMEGDIPTPKQVADMLIQARYSVEDNVDFLELGNKINETQIELEEARKLAQKYKHVRVDIGEVDLKEERDKMDKMKREYDGVKEKADKFRGVFNGGRVQVFSFLREGGELRVLLPLSEHFGEIGSLVYNHGEGYFKDGFEEKDMNGVIYLEGHEGEDEDIKLSENDYILQALGIEIILNNMDSASLVQE